MNIKSKKSLISGNFMPIMGLGTWMTGDETARIVDEALRLGYPMIDTSGDYGTQPGIADGLNASEVKRNEIFIVSKIEATDDAYNATVHNLDELEIDQADLMLIHWPPVDGIGVDLWNGLKQARDEGLVQDIGVSNYSVNQIEQLHEQTDDLPAVNQIEWSPFGHDREMLEFCTENGIVVQAYSPLTRGKRLEDSTLKRMGDQYNKTPAQIIIRWCLQCGVVPTIKASSSEHLKQNINVFDFELSDKDMTTLNNLNESYSAIGSSLAYQHA